jgi:His/Glu/Gln/Arg/opine family amino acid ABC transporter permease subunit
MNAYDYWSITQSALATISFSFASILFGVPIGLGLALLRWARVPVLSQLVIVYVSIIRSCPAVTLILLIFFALPQFGISLDPAPAAILALTIGTSAFNCEIWRSALLNFPRDQYDAARSFAMPRGLRFRRIVFPQIWQASLPGLISEMTLQVKSSPAIAVIGIVEITRAALRVGARTYDPLPPFMFALVLYSLIVFVLVKAQRVLEQRQPIESRT